MAISFGDNLDKSFAYTNGAFKKFSGWFILIILSAIIYGATFAMVFAMLAFIIGIFMALPASGMTETVDITTASGSYVDIGPVPMDPVFFSTGNEVLFSGLLIGGFLAVTLICTLVVLLAGCFQNGFILRVYRGGELNFKNLGRMFLEGIVYLVISVIYLLPYMIISELVVLGPIWNDAYFIIVCLLLPVILCVVSTILAVNAGIRYAKEGRFGAAFQIGKLCSIISNIGWLRYLGHIILFGLIIFAAELVLMMIPFAGGILLIVTLPFIMIFQAKFFANLYESGEALEKPAEVSAAVE
ncbi:MAG TPA: DUF4013 domain-containing protein [Methanocorpusculum sp.]|nr:DUF4013 domain-containing protein [Methanocorpusculum sp.]